VTVTVINLKIANRKSFRNRIEENIETAVAAFALEQPAFGQVRLLNQLRKRGVFVSPSGVRSVWLRRDLESFRKRLVALEKHVAATVEVQTEAQVVALERKQDDVLPTARSRLLTQGMGVIRILTDRGTEFCGKAESHDYQLYLALNDIEHTKTKVMPPQTNGIC